MIPGDLASQPIVRKGLIHGIVAPSRGRALRRTGSRRDPGVARVARLRHPVRKRGAGGPPPAPLAAPRGGVRHLAPLHRQHPLHQQHPPPRAAALPRQPRDRAAHQEPPALERDGDGGARQPRVARHRRAHLHLCLGGHAARDRLQPLLPRQGSRVGRRSGLLPGSRLPRHLRARVSGGAHHRDAARELPPRASPGRRALLVSASLAHAELLGVPDGLDGARADHRDLSGALQPLPGGSRAHRAFGQGVGVPRRRRDGRTGSARRDQPRLAREARQPDLRRQLQPAAPRRAGPRQRQDHPGAGGELPRRRLERHQGHLGKRLGSSSGAGHRGRAGGPHGVRGGRRLSEVLGGGRRLYPRALLRHRPATDGDGGGSHRRGDPQAPPRRPRSGEGLRRLQGGGRAHRLPHRHPGQDDQGLRPRRGGRRQEHHPPAEEAQRGGAARVPLALRHPDLGRGRGAGALLSPGRGQPGDALPPRAAQVARRVSPRAARASAQAGDACRGHLRGVHRGGRGQGDGHHHGRRPHARQAPARQERRQAHRADRPRRGAHLRHGSALPPGRHLLARRAEIRAGGPRNAPLLQGSRPTGRSWRKGSPRRARCPRSSPPAPPTPRTA